MSRWLPFLLVLPACATTEGPAKDGEETDVAGDSSDTGADSGADDDTSSVGDTEDTGSTRPPSACKLLSIPSATQASAEPDMSEQIKFQRRIHACASGTGLTGRWEVLVTNAAKEQVCAFAVDFTSTEVTSACPTCDRTYASVAFSGTTTSDADLCALFALDTDFVASLTATYTTVGTTADGDLLYETGAASWLRIDEQGVFARYPHDDADYLTVDFSIGYPYGE